MNTIAKEFDESVISWDNAKLSSIAKEHGGPKQFIEHTFQAGYEDGYGEGYLSGETAGNLKCMVIAGISASIITVLGVTARYFYKKSKDQERRIDRQFEQHAKDKADEFMEEVLAEVREF